MATFLVWNVARKPLGGLLAAMVNQFGIDVVLLLERPSSDPSFRFGLDATGGVFEELASQPNFGVFSRTGAASLAPFDFATIPRTPRFDIWRLSIPNCPEMALGLVHGPDLRNNPDPEDRRLFFGKVGSAVEAVEDQVGHRRCLVAGDFNANPFEPVIGGVEGLHAIRLKSVRGKPARNVAREPIASSTTRRGGASVPGRRCPPARSSITITGPMSCPGTCSIRSS